MRIIGHRGARGEAPENTLGGFRYIQQLGLNAVEFDVRQLKDDQLVIMHDDNFIRTTGQQYALYDCQSADLASFNQAYIWQDWPHIEVTPFLSDTLQIIQHFEHIEVEVKAVDTPQQAEHLVLALQQHLADFQHNAVITSFDLKIHQALQQINSKFRHGLLIEDDLGQQAIEQAVSLGCCQMGWKDALASDEIIQATQNAHLGISIWTVNDVSRAQHLRDQGIDGLITDFPKMMLRAL